jgi:hypothetical protein
VHTTIPLGTRIRFARFVLAVRFMAMRTFHHTPILAHPFSHSDRVMQYTFQHVIAPV